MPAEALRKSAPARPDVPGAVPERGARIHSNLYGDTTISRDHDPEHASGAGQDKVTWIVVANGCRARIFEKSGRNAAIRPAMSHDLYGACGPRSARDRAMSMQPLMDPFSDARKREFAQAVARYLQECLGESRFDQLVLVAPPQTLGDLKGALPSAVRARVKCDIHRNLMNAASFEIADYLGNAVRD